MRIDGLFLAVFMCLVGVLLLLREHDAPAPYPTYRLSVGEIVRYLPAGTLGALVLFLFIVAAAALPR